MNEKIIQVRGQGIHVRSSGSNSLPVIVFLHGFTGSTATWLGLVDMLEGEYKTVTVDLTGHGKTTVPNEPSRYSMAEQITDLEALFDKLQLTSFTLVGYSMGGRIALAYTYRYPTRVTSLILESSSPGIKDESERLERQIADNKLSDRIRREGIPLFVEFWENIALFNSQKRLSAEVQSAVREERLSQNVTGLANSLIGIGTGTQPSYWDKLQTINIPILLITGEIDTKFVNIAQEMMKYLPLAKHRTIKDTGHAIHVEKPTLFATMVKEHVTQVLNLRR
ncbi:2-succinyl-6-hydroxy-2,4-cyclohexadiene-1-carboxylate synthase [Sporosarcina sp. G11-34]|uniref:2-succinyl-6-hydroxy-2, 4-cyclohexadiene-1-carboxylate synthase n=1 Tax=Sporosarcina sp. G11-34 TaxID=2849605 RepID=UPI0022A98086|nr:2-succinyl-6-hydroxy-2,4-cyclohexadiene-1-carboxylate synthase [Sporosarcina sp. G11-34]MCZ2260707.1 2-succinyl-6-hydroxy-2,4-cyclohexadiene-1-carboxylate synthase [Sporosarcina sp. G11-34]